MSDYSDWIGRERRVTEEIGERLLTQYRATLAGMLGPGEVPAGFHWCLAPDVVEPAELGRDGHPRTGIFLPALPLPRRMWAGGALEYRAPLMPGDTVTRISTIRDVTFKQGRSGPLGFVTVDHVYEAGGEAKIVERHDIVYREDPKPGSAVAAKPAEDWSPLASWKIAPTPTLLFRYSALTFNGHRIHYDHPYATGVEGYDGLVVHGPLQSIWMQNLAASILGRLPESFSYRGLSPLTCDRPVSVEAREAEGGGLELRVRRDEDGVVTMQATTPG
ncbi:MaoC family dehydratase N-terminal domain-containing protein [Stappia sp. MMSF_3263]|uniref:FAS1-like dehydratase domain-containing protein n=1 Tax=Stappia sp. MMSF_3263 TaxID=3046693 RepID=UPI00273E2606|nr:MaoC family dehydratase N-terminal domain-containing protein [Stappia sp. MMSF_3263]